MSSDNLVHRIRGRSRTDMKNGVELANLAKDLDDAIKGFFGAPQTVAVEKFMGTYARVKKRWCEISGEPLVPRSVSRTAAAVYKALQPARKVS